MTDSTQARGEIALLDILVVLVHARVLILAAALLFAVGGVVLSYLLPVEYAATATLLPPQQSGLGGSSLAAQFGGMGGMAALAGSTLGIKNPNDMFVGVMKSRSVEDAVIERYKLEDVYHARYLSDARRRFESSAEIDGSGKDGFIRLTFEDRDPNRAAEVANGYVAEFQKFLGNLAVTEAAQRRLFFEQQLDKAKNNLAEAEESLVQTEQKTGVIQLDSQARALIESAAALRAQVTAKEVQVQSLRLVATDQNAQLAQAEQELSALRGQLAKLNTSDGSGDMLVGKGRVPEAGTEYVRKLRDVKYYETIFEILARQFESAKLDEAKQGASMQIVDMAVRPEHRSSPRRGRIVLLATVLGLILGIFAALIRAGLSDAGGHGEFHAALMRLKSAFTTATPRTRRV